jgi:mono/diheme cytochrome c family protein
MRALSSHPLRSLIRLTGAVAIALSIGCGTGGTVASVPAGVQTAQASGSLPDRAHIVAVYRSHCGACHRPVAPGSEPNDRLQAELTIHHKRTRLSDAEWAGLDAFLARP